MQEWKSAPDYSTWTPHDFDEERDLKVIKVWPRGVAYSTPPFKPFVKWIWRIGSAHAQRVATEGLCVPGSHGINLRFIEGYMYMSPAVILDENERKAREPIYRDRIAPYIEDFGKEWGKARDAMIEKNKRLEKAKPAEMNNIELLDHLYDWMQLLQQSWNTHHLTMYATNSIYLFFTDLCKELLGMDEHQPQIKKLLSGFDNLLFRANAALWQLGIRATELGLDQLFLATKDDGQLLSQLEESEAGKSWLQEFNAFLWEHGWRCGRIYDASLPSWVEKPTLAIPDVKKAIVAIAEKGSVFTLDEVRQSLASERAEAEKEVLSQVPVAQREWFGKLMQAAQWSSVWCEDHTLPTDMASAALGRRVAMEWGKRFTKAGVIDDPEDIFFLTPDELELPSTIMERCVMSPLIERRKKRYAESLKWDLPIFIGDPSALAEGAAFDPILRIIATLPIVKPELKADLYGAASAPGVVEGIARVLFSLEELGELRPGEILVAPFTHAAWTPAFPVASGVVTDAGGSLSHTVIVAREYCLPCVAGCMEATKKIKTGDRLKVDGTMGAVYILR